MFGERRSRSELGFAALAFAGVVVVVAGASGAGSSLEGNVYAFLNLLVFTGYFVSTDSVCAIPLLRSTETTSPESCCGSNSGR